MSRERFWVTNHVYPSTDLRTSLLWVGGDHSKGIFGLDGLLNQRGITMLRRYNFNRFDREFKEVTAELIGVFNAV